MPELPDVENYKIEAEKAVGSAIRSIDITDKKFVDLKKSDLDKYFIGKKIKDLKRQGKFLFLETEGGNAIAIHFGMTGTLEFDDSNQEVPRYAKCIFQLENDRRLVYSSRRKLGKVEIATDTEQYIHDRELGQDALEISKTGFIEALKKSRSSIKGFLTNQSVIAGIGNVYADEILFQSRIHPREQTKDLSDKQIGELYGKMKKVLEKAIEKQADVSRLPGSWLLPRRKEGEECPQCSGRVEKIKISGRNGYYCPDCQEKST